MHAQMRMHRLACACTRACMQARMRTHTHTHTHTLTVRHGAGRKGLCWSLSPAAHTHTRTCAHMYARTYTLAHRRTEGRRSVSQIPVREADKQTMTEQNQQAQAHNEKKVPPNAS